MGHILWAKHFLNPCTYDKNACYFHPIDGKTDAWRKSAHPKSFSKQAVEVKLDPVLCDFNICTHNY